MDSFNFFLEIEEIGNFMLYSRIYFYISRMDMGGEEEKEEMWESIQLLQYLLPGTT